MDEGGTDNGEIVALGCVSQSDHACTPAAIHDRTIRSAIDFAQRTWRSGRVVSRSTVIWQQHHTRPATRVPCQALPLRFLALPLGSLPSHRDWIVADGWIASTSTSRRRLHGPRRALNR